MLDCSKVFIAHERMDSLACNLTATNEILLYIPKHLLNDSGEKVRYYQEGIWVEADMIENLCVLLEHENIHQVLNVFLSVDISRHLDTKIKGKLLEVRIAKKDI